MDIKAQIKRTAFSIPYVDQPTGFWEQLKQQFQTDIAEVYFPLIDPVVGSGRPLQPDRYLVSFLESKLLPVSVLINPVVLPDQFDTVKTRLLEEIETYLKSYDLKGVTISNLSLAKELKKTFPGIQTTASTLMEMLNRDKHTVTKTVVLDYKLIVRKSSVRIRNS